MAVVMAAEQLLALATLSDQIITLAGRMKRVPNMTREEIMGLLKEANVDTDKLIEDLKAELEKLREEVNQ